MNCPLCGLDTDDQVITEIVVHQECWNAVPDDAVLVAWRDHIPSGYEDMTGYGQVSCSCGWDSGDKLGWEAHIDAAERIGRA